MPKPLVCPGVVAVGSRSQDKSDEFVRSVVGAQGAKAYGSYDAVFEDPAVDAVYIPLPSGIHLEWVRKAAAKGKHILLEKPICTVYSLPCYAFNHHGFIAVG